jgi:hypothetical protein
MNKSAIFKSAIISAMLVAMVVALVPAVSATIYTDTKTASGAYGASVGAGVQGDKISSQYYDCRWHSGVWGLGGGVTFYSLSWTFKANGATVETGTTFVDTTHDKTLWGPYSNIGASATGGFRYNGGSVYYVSTSQAYIS